MGLKQYFDNFAKSLLITHKELGYSNPDLDITSSTSASNSTPKTRWDAGRVNQFYDSVKAELAALRLTCRATVTAAQPYINQHVESRENSASGGNSTGSSSTSIGAQTSSTTTPLANLPTTPSGSLIPTITPPSMVLSSVQLTTMKKVVISAIAKLLLSIHSLQEKILDMIGEFSIKDRLLCHNLVRWRSGSPCWKWSPSCCCRSRNYFNHWRARTITYCKVFHS